MSNGIRCPVCGGHSRVLWTRITATEEYSRRRECIADKHRWTTLEKAVSPLGVMKADPANSSP